MAKPTTSPAKLQMIKFIESTREQPEFKFNIRGTKETAEKFIHRMRVELSRMRNTVIESGRVPKEFKVLTHEIVYNREHNLCRVTLHKSTGFKSEIANEVGDIFDDIAGGGMIE